MSVGDVRGSPRRELTLTSTKRSLPNAIRRRQSEGPRTRLAAEGSARSVCATDPVDSRRHHESNAGSHLHEQRVVVGGYKHRVVMVGGVNT